MSDENKTIELKEDKLNKVSGGFGIEEEAIIIKYKTFKAGDCFKNKEGNIRLKIVNDCKVPVDKPQEIDVYWVSSSGYQKTHFSSNNKIFTTENFQGNNVF